MVNPAELLEPHGLVNVAMFPGESNDNLVERLQVYITEGINKQAAPPDDDATKAWAYHRAFFAVYTRMSANPMSVSANEEGGHQFVQVQAERFLKMAEEQLGIFNGIVESAPAKVAIPSGAVKTTFTW